jgi:hypothetical protein
MPRFSRAVDAFLKKTMLPRAPECVFSQEDIDLIAKETKLKPTVILHWGANLRWKNTHNWLGRAVASVEDYLKASEESLAAQVRPSQQRLSHTKIYLVDFVGHHADSWFSQEVVVKMKRCYVSMFNVGRNLVENMTADQFLFLAYNEETGVAEGFMEFSEQVRTNTVKDRLADLGAGSISVMTFQNNDGNHSAASALNRVRSVAKSDGFAEVVHGECNTKLMEKADDLVKIEKKKYCATCGARQEHGTPQKSPAGNDEVTVEFDVMKKRRLMDAAEADECNEDCPEACSYFKQFEMDVLGALIKSMARVHEDEYQDRMRELLQGDFEDTREEPLGGVYFAKSDALPGVIKIGATRRSGPEQRLYELSRCVPKPFQLLKWIPDHKPFSLENKIHRHFAERRLKETGAGTEFFEIDVMDIDTMMKSLAASSNESN